MLVALWVCTYSTEMPTRPLKRLEFYNQSPKLHIKPALDRSEITQGGPVRVIGLPPGKLLLDNQVVVPTKESVPLTIVFVVGQEVGGVVVINDAQAEVAWIGQSLQPFQKRLLRLDNDHTSIQHALSLPGTRVPIVLRSASRGRTSSVALEVSVTRTRREHPPHA